MNDKGIMINEFVREIKLYGNIDEVIKNIIDAGSEHADAHSQLFISNEMFKSNLMRSRIATNREAVGLIRTDIQGHIVSLRIHAEIICRRLGVYPHHPFNTRLSYDTKERMENLPDDEKLSLFERINSIKEKIALARAELKDLYSKLNKESE